MLESNENTASRNYGTGMCQDLSAVQPLFPQSRDLNQKYSTIGRSGVRVSRICLGTLNFGQLDEKFGKRPGQLNEQKAHEILTKYVELGGNCLDTGNFFPWIGTPTEQTAEKYIGSWLKNVEREKLFIISKVGLPDCDGIKNEDINSYGLSRMNLINSLENILERLQTKYIDLLQIQAWDPSVNVYDVVRDLDELIKKGKIRYFGVSNFKGWQLQKILDASRMLSLYRCIAYDGEYNLLTRGAEIEIAEVCKLEKVGFFAHSPLKYGLLSDKYSSSSQKAMPGSRIDSASGGNLASMSDSFAKLRQNPVFISTMDTLQKISNKNKLSMSQVAILYALNKKFLTSVVVSVSTIKELEENMNILNQGLKLNQEDIDELNSSSTITLQYPNIVSLVNLDDSENILKGNSLLPALLANQVLHSSMVNRIAEQPQNPQQQGCNQQQGSNQQQTSRQQQQKR